MSKAKVIRDLRYAEAHERHVGDLWLPERPLEGAPPVLLIHGGGWNALTKESIEPVAHLAVTEGRSVFSINYRLLDHAPWPACRDDCVTAARFVLAGGLVAHGLPTPTHGKLLVVGASAGGHLAMMTGLALGAHACISIISLAGPSRVDPRDDVSKSAILQPGFLGTFFGREKPPATSDFATASPSALVDADAPPLHIIHSRNDRLVPTSHSKEATAAWRAAGVPARIDWFDGPGDLHGFWTTDDFATRKLIPPLAKMLRAVLAPAASQTAA